MENDRGRTTSELAADVELARSVYDITEPTGDQPWEEMAESDTAVWLAVGLLQRSRRLLMGVIALHDADVLDSADSTARSILEYAITGYWLLSDPEANVPKFLGSALGHVRAMEQIKPALYGGLGASYLNAFPDAVETNLPGLKKRMGNLDGLYWVYKMLCETTHPTLVASFFAFDWDEESNVLLLNPTDEWDRVVHREFVLFSAFWTWVLAMRIEEESDHSTFPHDLKQLRLELLAAISYDSDNDTFAIPDWFLKPSDQ